MQYLSVEEAQQTPGLKLVLTQGVPGPWSEFAKYMFGHHQLDYVAVAQKGGGRNPELVAWTRHRNAPIALYKEEAPRVRWLELLDLAERLGTGSSLIPSDTVQRMAMIGLCNEIAGESSFAWNARLLMLDAGVQAAGQGVTAKNPMYADYQYDSDVIASAKEKVETFLAYFTELLQEQKKQGSDYIIGDNLTAVDLCWAAFSNMLQSLPEADNPMPNGLRQSWAILAKNINAYDPILINHRDRIFAKHLSLPLHF